MANLPVKSKSRGIQKQHIRVVPTTQGMKPVVVNKGNIHPVIQKVYPQQRPMTQPQPAPRPLPVVLRPKPRPLPWWEDLELFKQKALQWEHIREAADEVTNEDIFWNDVFSMFQVENEMLGTPYQTKQLDESSAEKLLKKFNDEFSDGSDQWLINFTGGKERVTLMYLMGNIVLDDIDKWHNSGRVIGIDEDGMPSGPGTDYSLIEIKGRLDNSAFEVADDDLESYLKDETELKSARKLKELTTVVPNAIAVFPSTWYENSTLVAVPKKDEKKARKFLEDVLFEKKSTY